MEDGGSSWGIVLNWGVYADLWEIIETFVG